MKLITSKLRVKGFSTTLRNEYGVGALSLSNLKCWLKPRAPRYSLVPNGGGSPITRVGSKF